MLRFLLRVLMLGLVVHVLMLAGWLQVVAVVKKKRFGTLQWVAGASGVAVVWLQWCLD